MAADLPKLASVGDTVECDVRHPYQRTIRMVLETREAAAHANDLLLDPKSGWRLAAPAGVAAPADACSCPCCQQGIEAPHEYHLERRQMLRPAGVPAVHAPRRWIERWYGSGSDRGWWVWEAERGDRIAYCGEGEFAERLCSLIVQKHNDALGVAESRCKTLPPSDADDGAPT